MLRSNSALVTAVCAVMLCPALLAQNAEADWEQHLLEGQDFLKKARFPEAERALLKALAKAEKLGRQTWPYALTLNNLACLDTNLGRYAEAERFSRQALELMQRIVRFREGCVRSPVRWESAVGVAFRARIRQAHPYRILGRPLSDRTTDETLFRVS
jgi:tetratricopeptide (TPR) repeat protein